MAHPFTNDLINETSPYLLQHAHNPIRWHAWHDAVLATAQADQKLLVISIGYAACHWCHVMERESFEDLEVAKIMNAHYYCIKVDREERPDIDQIYMDAIQLMTGAGGWPLNVVALPDGRPIWGGTYFKKDQWISALEQIAALYNTNPKKLQDYADQLEQGIQQLHVIPPNREPASFPKVFLADTVIAWASKFDHVHGGMKGAPKFMMPNNYHFLLRYAHQTQDAELLAYVNLTLKQMAFGGVFDQIGGGFSRYAVDDRWHVPHFEKMLYDNAQLVSLYADAYLITANEHYREVITETLAFVERELTGDEGNFYSSIDADSPNAEGLLEEGAYYVWDKDRLKSLLKSDYDLFADYYNINAYGLWEHGRYVPVRKDDDGTWLESHPIGAEALAEKKQEWKALLMNERDQRERPRLDDKTLTSWNALMLKGYLDAYRVLENPSYLVTALKNAEFLRNTQWQQDGSLNHNYKDGTSNIPGFLEDYAATMDAFIALYEHTLDTKWLMASRDLAHYTLDHFFDDQSKLFFFTSDTNATLISRPIEYRDNVIPASNSIMAKNLFKLSHHFDNTHFMETAMTMLHQVKPELTVYPSGHSNWLDLMLNVALPFYEVAVLGDSALEKIRELNSVYVPNKLIAGSLQAAQLPLLEHRHVPGQTLIYICMGHHCQRPVSKVEAAIQQLKIRP